MRAPINRASIDMNQPAIQVVNHKWRRQISAARIAWRKLTEEELLASEGKAQNLIALLQEHYALSLDEAAHKVTNFMARRDY